MPSIGHTSCSLARSCDGADSSSLALKLFTHQRADPRLGEYPCLSTGSIHLEQQRYDETIANFYIGLRHREASIGIMLELRYWQTNAHSRKGDISDALRE